MRAHKKTLSILPAAYICLIVAIALAATSCTTLQPTAASFETGIWTGSPQVQTRQGIILGKKDKANTISWKGIPYAAPPVGELRWKAPRDPQGWLGIREASGYGPMPIQYAPIVNIILGSEDCLYLNVWRPDSQETNLPVYVWIYGGSNSTGAANLVSDYEGYARAQGSNAVVVSFNYRVGAFGWLSHPSLRAGASPEDASGNFGTLDSIKALEWVQKNISAFGGDAGNVTIAGESAGGLNVISLLASPKAKGLFHKAIAQSGYRAEWSLAQGDNFAHQIIRTLLLQAGLAGPDNVDIIIAQADPVIMAAWLRSIDVGKIMAATRPLANGMLSFPGIYKDGTVFPLDGFSALSDAARVNAVPLIIGTNKEESKLFLWLSGENSHRDEYQAFAEFASEQWKAIGADSIADALGKSAPAVPVYVYRFDWGALHEDGTSVLPAPSARTLGAFHGLDISFFLGTETLMGNLLPVPIFTRENQPGRAALKAAIADYITAFLWTGNPNDAIASKHSRPQWSSWDATLDSPAFMLLDATLTQADISLASGRTTLALTLEKLERLPEPARSAAKKMFNRYRVQWPVIRDK